MLTDDKCLLRLVESETEGGSLNGDEREEERMEDLLLDQIRRETHL